jgi:hypothetical protein
MASNRPSPPFFASARPTARSLPFPEYPPISRKSICHNKLISSVQKAANRLTPDEAATRIQACYRGWLVRKKYKQDLLRTKVLAHPRALLLL